MPYIEIELEGETLQLEISEQQLAGRVAPTGIAWPKGRINETLIKIDPRKVLDKIFALGTLVMKAKERFEHPPTEVEVEFGLSFDVEANILISSGKTGAHMQVTFKWAFEEQNH